MRYATVAACVAAALYVAGLIGQANSYVDRVQRGEPPATWQADCVQWERYRLLPNDQREVCEIWLEQREEAHAKANRN